MKIIILAAGKGERLMPLTRNTPKPLIDIGDGKTLLEEQIDRLQKSGAVDEIVLVVGYLAEQIEAKLKMLLNTGIKITTVFNPFYELSNNLLSLWLAKHEMNDQFLITNGDNLFSSDVIRGFTAENRDGIFLSICPEEAMEDDNMKVLVHDNTVTKVSKLIPNKQAHAESPGLVMVSGAKSSRLFKNALEALARKADLRQGYWLEVFNHLHDIGVPVRPWEFDGAAHWREIDFHLDIHKAKALFQLENVKQEDV